jgi:hypothetical protein
MHSDSAHLKSSKLADPDTGFNLATTRILYPYEYWHQSRQNGADDRAYISLGSDSDSSIREDRIGGSACSSDPLWYSATSQFTASMPALCAIFRKWVVCLARIFIPVALVVRFFVNQGASD